jgi:hypothetical protein
MHFTRSQQGHLAGILGALALFGAGCGSSQNSSGGQGYASFAWRIYDLEDTTFSRVLDCSAVGAANVVVTLTNVQSGVAYPQSPASCSDLQMSTAYVPAGDYNVGFDLYGKLAIYGNTTTLLDSFDVGDINGNTAVIHLYSGLNDFRTPYAAFITQSFFVDWSIYNQGVPTTCSNVGAADVDLDFEIAGSSTQITSSFTCSTGSGASFAIPFGATTAQWQLYLVDPNGTNIGSLPGATVGVPSNSDVNLGQQYFDL